MRIRSLLSAAVLAGGLVSVAAPAMASPSQLPEGTLSCTLTVTDLYYATGMNNAFARLSGGCTGPINIVLERAEQPSGPFQEEPDALYYLQQAADGTAATASFLDPAQRGYCRAKATFADLVAVSANPKSC